MRADVNVSVRRPGDDLGTRCEVKNVNSVRYIMQAIYYEAQRQVDILEDGGTIALETRQFDPDAGETRSMRSKEEAHDYRYFPDPDLLPLEFDDAFIADVRKSLPELPDDKKARLVAELGLSPYNAAVLTAERESADYFEAVVSAYASKARKKPAEVAKRAANWVISDLFGHLNKAGKGIADSPVSPEAGAELLALVEDGVFTEKDCRYQLHFVWKVPEKEQEIPLDPKYKPKRNKYI